MKTEELLNELEERFGGSLQRIELRSPKRAYIDLDPYALPGVCRFLIKETRARFSIASGLDTPGAIEILYHFTVHSINLLISLRIRLDRGAPRVASLAAEFESLNWIEREIRELLGVEFTGHPDPRGLLLPEQWPEGVYPLRQDYREWDPSAVRTRGVR